MRRTVVIISAWVGLFLAICSVLYPIMLYWAVDGIVPAEYIPQALMSSTLLTVPLLFIIRGSIIVLLVATFSSDGDDHDTTDER